MADETQIIDGFYKNYPISIRGGTVAGGKNYAVHKFPNRDTQNVEVLSVKTRQYSLEIIVSEKGDLTYFDYRDGLIEILEKKGAGELVHPLYGRIDDIEAVTYSLNEKFNQFGDSVIAVNFEINNNQGIPQTSVNVSTQIAAAADVVVGLCNIDIAENFTVDTSFAGNFAAAVDKVNGVIDQVKESTAFIGEAANDINAFTDQIGQMSANINSLVTAPLSLANSFTSLFESVNGLYASAVSTFDTFVDFFDFGDDDSTNDVNNPVSRLDTAGKVNRKKNNDVVNGAVAATVLAYSYQSALKIDFANTREINEIAATLDVQFERVMTSGSTQDVKDAVTDMRIKTLASLEQLRVITSQVVEVETNPTTARLLAFNYYGDDERGDEIIALNEFSDVSFIQGDVEVLSS